MKTQLLLIVFLLAIVILACEKVPVVPETSVRVDSGKEIALPLENCLTLVYTDPVNDHTGEIDVVEMTMQFNHQTGAYALKFVSTGEQPFTGEFLINVNLFNPDAEPEHSLFQDVLNDFTYTGATTTLVLEGVHPSLTGWDVNDRVATNTLAGLGNPPSSTFFRSSVSNFPLGFLTNEDAIAYGEAGVSRIVDCTGSGGEGTFTLVNSDSDEDIRRLEPVDTLWLDETGDQLNIRADFPDWQAVGSVVFYLNGVRYRTENSAPFALAGDGPSGDYFDWTPLRGRNYEVRAVSYSEPDGRGDADPTLRSLLHMQGTPSTWYPSVEGFSIVNAATDRVIRTTTQPLERIDLAKHGGKLNVQANAHSAKSVIFYLDGKKWRTENIAPFTLFGDYQGDYFEWMPKPGRYVVRAVPCAEKNGKGVRGLARELILDLRRD